MSLLIDSAEWIADCRRWYGNRPPLRGRLAHWCGEWDDLPIDETCGEFSCCTCTWEDPELQVLSKAAREEQQRLIHQGDGEGLDEIA